MILLADVDLKQVLTAIVPLVLLVVWIISQVFGQKEAEANKAKPAGNPRPRADEAGMRDEIERFLREAKQQQQEPQNPEMAAARRLKRQQEKQEKERSKQARQNEAARERARAAAAGSQRIYQDPEIIEDVHIVPSPSVSQHVSTYMDSSKFSQSAAKLGEEVGLSDERLEERLQQTFDHNQSFDHKISNFAGEVGEVERGGAAVRHSVTSAAQISVLLRNPTTFRQVLIMNEILNRPDHLWD